MTDEQARLLRSIEEDITAETGITGGTIFAKLRRLANASDDLSGAVGVQPPDGTTERDAARYRWLRSDRIVSSDRMPSAPWVVRLERDHGMPAMRRVFGIVLDHAINAAMTAEREAAEPSMSTTSPPENSGTDDMDLPTGKTCGDCGNWSRCKSLIGSLKPTNTRCDWAPSRFRPAIEGGAKP